MVPDVETARAIYLAVAKGRKYRVTEPVEVDDEGSHWEVFEYMAPKVEDFGHGKVTVTVMAGGGLQMEIDKCTGAMAAHYTR